MKKKIALLMALCLFVFSGCQSPSSGSDDNHNTAISAKFMAGTYEGSAQGMGGEVGYSYFYRR